MFTLIIEDKDGAIADEYSFEEGEFIVGRSHSSDIILPSDNVSRRHARLYTQTGRCYIEDLNSSNGVFVNGKRIHRPFEIVRSAQIKVGDYYLHVEGTSYGDQDVGREVERQQGAAFADDMGVDMESDAPSGQIYGRLIGTNLSTQGRPFDITKPVNLVGRGKDCAVTIIDQSVSRIHAKVLRTPDGQLAVEDLRSSNGCYVNDNRVTTAEFHHGDRVRFGNVEFICEMPGMGDPEVVEVSSGGRKGLIALVIFLILAVVGSSVTIFLLRDSIWPDKPAVEGASKEELERKAEELEAEREEQYANAERKIKNIVEKAETLAGGGKWDKAQKQFVRGAKQLERYGKLDTDGKLTAYFEDAETALREDRAQYETFARHFSDEDYKKAGLVYQRMVELEKSPHLGLAKKKVEPFKSEQMKLATALCEAKAYAKCLKRYQRAKDLDPSDAELQKKVAQIRMKLATEKKEPPTPTPPPTP